MAKHKEIKALATHHMPNLVMLGAVDQVFEATRVEHAIDRITLPIDKRQLNRMQYVGTRVKAFQNHI